MGAVVSAFLRKWVQSLVQYLNNSDYLAGMLAMSMMGVARDGASKLLRMFMRWISRRLWITVRLDEKDAELVSAWLRERPEVHDSTRLWLYSHAAEKGNARTYEYEPELEVTTRLWCTRKDGLKQLVWVTRSERSQGSGDRRVTGTGATVSFFRRDKAMLESILEEGREIQKRRREKYLTVVQVYDYGKEHGLNWLHPQDKDRKQPGRSISSVVLPRCSITGLDQSEALLEDAKEFLTAEAWYTDRGIPYRRGYLLHGVPGGGKSSLIMAVASELRLPIYMMQLSSELMSDDTLNSLLQYGMHDPPSILLLEDVDLLHSAVLHRRSIGSGKHADVDEEAESDRNDLESGRNETHNEHRRRRGRLTLSGLLNALDGPTATTGRLLFMTTNAKHRLDPALLRSGRIDYELEFKAAGHEQIQRMFTRFYDGARKNPGVECPKLGNAAVKTSKSIKDIATGFAQQIEDSGLNLSTADIQGHLMSRKASPERALSELPNLLKTLQEGKRDASSKGSSAPATSAKESIQSTNSAPATSAKDTIQSTDA